MLTAHRIRRALASPFAGNPYWLQRLRWPNPFLPPYRQTEITLYRPGELGDVVMCLAVVRAIRRRNPGARITFVTKYTELIAGHPLLDRVLSPEAAEREGLRRMIPLRYEVFVPLRLHMIAYLGGCVGLRAVEPVIPLPDFSSELGPLADLLPTGRPRVMLCRQAGQFTPNKAWPEARWDGLVRRLVAVADVIELGQTASDRGFAPGPGYLDLRGRTSIRQYCALIARADLVITPASSAIHLAAAYERPVLSVMSGYESPVNSAYPTHTALHRAVPCSPCWLRTPCPHGLTCLQGISEEEVASTALRLLGLAGKSR